MTRCDMGNVATYSYKKNNHEESREKSVKIWHGSDSRKMCLSIYAMTQSFLRLNIKANDERWFESTG